MSTGAIIAAVKEQQKQEEEIRYTEEAHSQDLEFKILRCMTGAFGKPEVMKIVIEEESQNGWILLEKFDEYRLRFYRKRGFLKKTSCSIEPYRTVYGISQWRFTALIIASTLIATLMLVFVLSLLL